MHYLDISDHGIYGQTELRKFSAEFKEMAAKLQDSDADKSDWLARAETELQSRSWHRWQRTEPVPSMINARQVIEGAAVLCSYRICYPRPSHEDFLRHISQYYPEAHRLTYGYAYVAASSLLGEFAFDLFAPACFLALQSEDPGHNLHAILLRAKEYLEATSLNREIEDPLTFLLNAMNVREDRRFPLTMKYAISQGSRVPIHPVLQPYVERVAQVADDLRVCDFFARPYFYNHYSGEMENKLKDFLADMLPPAHIYQGDVSKCLRTGLAKRLGNEYIRGMFNLSAIVGLADRLFTGTADRDSHYRCKLADCPFHKTDLCWRYFAYPTSDFRECQFPELLSALNLQDLRHSVSGGTPVYEP